MKRGAEYHEQQIRLAHRRSRERRERQTKYLLVDDRAPYTPEVSREDQARRNVEMLKQLPRLQQENPERAAEIMRELEKFAAKDGDV